MPRPQPKFTEAEKEEIALELKRTKDKRSYLKLKILQMKADSRKSEDVGKETGYHKDSVNRLVSRYKAKGMHAVLNPRYGQNSSYSSREKESEFLSRYEKRAAAGEVLEVSEIARDYCTFIGREMTLVGIYKMLHRHGWRKVMPRSRHEKKASEEDIRAFKKNP